MKWVTVVLSFALVCCQYSLLVRQRQHRTQQQSERTDCRSRRKNRTLALRNHSLAAEVYDLENGQEAISEIARVELGYIQDGETFYRLIRHNR
ncbi:septum formation initiator family protein [Neisseria meningitidis]